MTQEQSETAIRNMIERMNRIEAAVAHLKPLPCPVADALENVIATLERATKTLASRLSDA